MSSRNSEKTKDSTESFDEVLRCETKEVDMYPIDSARDQVGSLPNITGRRPDPSNTEIPDDAFMQGLTRADTRYSVNQIFQGQDEEGIAVQRYQTRNTIISIRDQEYEDLSFIPIERKDTVLMDGAEYADVDPELVTWDGDDDAKNPRNWSKARKTKCTLLASAFCFVITMTSSVPSPAVPYILQDFDNSNLTVGSLIVSIMLIAWSMSILVVAPLSEVLGRQIVLLGSMTGGFIFMLACAAAPNVASLLVFRFIGGVLNCAPLAVAAGTIADLYDERGRNWPLAWFSVGPSCGPAMAPAFAGFAAQGLSWRWCFWIGAIINGAVVLAGYVFFEETYAPVLLHRKAKKLQKETGNPNLHTIWEVDQEPFLLRIKNAVIRPVQFLTMHPVVFALGLHMGFVYAFMYLMLVTFSTLWTHIYGYSVGISGLMYFSLFLGLTFGTLFWTPLITKHCDKKAAQGIGKPEDKLFYLPVSTIVMAIGLFWYGWSAAAKLHWIMPEIGVVIFGFGLFVVFQTIQVYLVCLNTRLASSIIASVALGRTMMGGTFPLFGRAMYNKLGYGFANTVVGCLMLVLGLPAPLIIIYKGEQIRQWLDKRWTIG